VIKLVSIDELSPELLNVIKNYAFLRYNVDSVADLKSAIVDIEFEIIINEYLDNAKTRIMRIKMDEYKAYVPTDEELIAQVQKRIDAEIAANEPDEPPEEPPV